MSESGPIILESACDHIPCAHCKRLDQERTTLANRWMDAREVIRSLRRGGCWCAVGTSPIAVEHAGSCLRARRIVEGLS